MSQYNNPKPKEPTKPVKPSKPIRDGNFSRQQPLNEKSNRPVKPSDKDTPPPKKG